MDENKYKLLQTLILSLKFLSAYWKQIEIEEKGFKRDRARYWDDAERRNIEVCKSD